MMSEFDLFQFFNMMEGALLVTFLGALLYFAYAAGRTRGGLWPRLLGIATLVRLLLLGVTFVAVGFAFWSISGSSPALTPNLPVTYETWILVGTLVILFSGVAELLIGLALIVGGWREGSGQGGRVR